ncbi:unnamed protein product, partial [Ectocarpus sp. 6 AP-2014]
LVVFSSSIVIHVQVFSSSDPPQRRNRSTVKSTGNHLPWSHANPKTSYYQNCQKRLARETSSPAFSHNIQHLANSKTSRRRSKTLFHQAISSLKHVALHQPVASPLNHRQNVETVVASSNRNTSDSTSNCSTHNIPNLQI